MRAIVFEADRVGYGIDQVSRPATVADVRRWLEDMEDDDLFILSHDRGYTYGSISCPTEYEYDEDEEEWEAL